MIKKHAHADVLTITTDDQPGKRIKVTDTVKNEEGQPAAGALVYLYLTDTCGWYAADAQHVLIYEGDMCHARLCGYVRTDKYGNFELPAAKPEKNETPFSQKFSCTITKVEKNSVIKRT